LASLPRAYRWTLSILECQVKGPQGTPVLREIGSFALRFSLA